MNAQVVIGDSQTNVTLVPAKHWDDLDAWETNGSFQIQRLRGEFRTLLHSPQRFVEGLDVLNRQLTGEASLAGIDDDFELKFAAGPRGAVIVKAAVRENLSYDARFEFEIDQSYLTPILRSLRTAFSVSP